jgi:hypothetical protein
MSGIRVCTFTVTKKDNYMYQELEELFVQLAGEISGIFRLIPSNSIFNPTRHGTHSGEGQTRYDASQSIFDVVGFNHSALGQNIRILLTKSDSAKKIVEWILARKLWPREVESVDTDFRNMPSISLNIVAGFFIRNFTINNYTFQITPESFSQAFEELVAFFESDEYTITTYLSLYGPHGDLSDFQLGEKIWIKRVDHHLAKNYCRNYSTGESHYIEMFDGDYVLQANYTLNKKDFLSVQRTEDPLLEKWFAATLLMSKGNIERGKILRETKQWPLLNVPAPNSPIYNPNLYGAHNKSAFQFNALNTSRLSQVSAVFATLGYDQLDKKLHLAFRRLSRFKAAKNLDDRVVELALALEYLINTKAFEVTLQLCLKATKLFAKTGEEKQAYDTISSFYSMRSKVVHGNSTIKDNEETRQLILDTEEIVCSILLRLIELNKKYSFKEISLALDHSLFLPQTLDEILKAETNK